MLLKPCTTCDQVIELVDRRVGQGLNDVQYFVRTLIETGLGWGLQLVDQARSCAATS